MQNNSHEIARQIRQEFFVYRNGLLADTLRNAGDIHKMIFGLNLSQITDIAKRFDANENVATELWNSRNSRECRLIAPMIFPIEKLSKDTAIQWITDTENYEVADNLCHKLLRYADFASEICSMFIDGTDMQRYIAMRLAINLLAIGKTIDTDTMRQLATNEINNKTSNTPLAINLIEEIDEII